MTSDLIFHRDGWPGSSSDDAEARSVTRLRIEVGDAILTRHVSKRGGTDSEAINTSLLPLGEFLANNWWTLLYEPLRPTVTDAFRVRHRLDSGMRGFAFPSIAVWSGGARTVMTDWASFENPFSTVSFLTASPQEPIQLEREATELELMDLVETIVERVRDARDGGRDLLEAWDRVSESISNPGEASYCAAAGRLGIDPYDPDAIDLTPLKDGIPEQLFDDVSEIVEIDDLVTTAAWIRDAEARLKLFPETDISYFGVPAEDNLADKPAVAGHASAEMLRGSAGLAKDPRTAVAELLGGAIGEQGAIASAGPDGINALVQRLDTAARIGAIAKSARQRRFRACSGLYMAWTTEVGQARATTQAFTRRQIASRAFAAELLAPQNHLLEIAPRHGFDDEDLEALASEFICPYSTVMWQAYRAGIPLRGIEIPHFDKWPVMTARASF